MNTKGFTLIELMIVVSVVAILASIAYPGYQSSMRKGHRADAQSYLMDLAQREQQYFMDNRAYATGADALNALNDPLPSTVQKYYTVAINTGATTTPPSFRITATPINSQLPDGPLTIDNSGARTPANVW